MFKRADRLKQLKFGIFLLVGLLGSLLIAGCGDSTAIPTASPVVTTIVPTALPATAANVPATTAIASTQAPAPTTAIAPTQVPIPTTAAAVTTTAATPTKAGPSSTAAASTATGALVLSGEKAYEHVKSLAITIGIRAAGTENERKAGDFIENYFKQLGLLTERPRAEFTNIVDKGSTITYTEQGGQSISLKGNAVNLSGTGKLTAPFSYVGLGLDGQIPTNSLKGKIALMQRGQLTFSEKLANAQAAGAIGVVIYNNVAGPLLNVTLSKQTSIPVLGLSQADGEKLRDELRVNKNLTGELNANVVSEIFKMTNVVGVRPANKENAPILIIGGHYDSVPAGPGANDNASGTALVMEIARVLQGSYPGYELRFIAFAGEEIGLAGSSDYVRQMSQDEIARVTAMINIDMISVGSQLYAGGAPELTKLAFTAANVEGITNIQPIPKGLEGASDHFPFQEAGIPVLFLNREADPNYHLPGDTADKVQPERLAQVGRIVIKVIDGLIKN